MPHIGKSMSEADAHVAQGPSGPVTVELSNPNSTSVTGNLYLRDERNVSFFKRKFVIDGTCPWIAHLPPLGVGETYYLTLTAAPSAQITIHSW